MMRVFSLVVSLTVLSFVLPRTSSGQSLADAAAKEKERRKGHIGHVYTEEDLRRAGGQRAREGAPAEVASNETAAPASESAAASKDAAKEGTAKPKTDDEVKADREAAWRQRLTKANADVARLSTEADTLQQGANDITQNLYGASRAGQLARLEETKKQLAAAKDSVSALEDEGRRSGFRP
jgi:hypothetical protein